MRNLSFSRGSENLKWGVVFMLLGACVLSLSAQGRSLLSGKVLSSDKSVIDFATVYLKGTQYGCTTNEKGLYHLKAPAGKYILTVSAIGFETVEKEVEILADGRSKQNVILKPSVTELDEVVVVGYGQMKRSDLTGSVVSVNDQAIKKSVPTSIDQVLQGRAAGVQIQANSGTPGASTSIQIRGINSLNATNQPIFVIDGVVVDSATDDENSNPLSSINPSDIVSMDVLKDASATAIYGSRASNGVIMITTKRGQAGEASITYDGYAGWQEMPKQLDMLKLQEYAQHQNARAALGLVDQSSSFIRPDMLGQGTNWQDELIYKAFMNSHNLSLSGGNE